ncbi:MAG: glucoamylase family protein [bacterium]
MRELAFLDTLEQRTFGFFWDLSDSATGLTPDRAPSESFASVGAVGFALTAYPIGVERGYITRAQARERVANTLQFFWDAPQDTTVAGATGYKGFFYHFLEPATGHRFRDVELSTVDTALLIAGALFCQSYFDGADASEMRIRALAESLYARVDWQWAQIRPPTIALGWKPESGHLPYDWRGYNEALILQLLALGSPTHPVARDAWDVWISGYRWGEFHGFEHVNFKPLFGHQYSHVWIDFRGIADAYMRERGIDYFENSRRATYSQRAYAIANPGKWAGYGENVWGLTACDGPLDRTLEIGGVAREFHTYWARGAAFYETSDDGTIAPTAAGASIAFAPEIALPALLAMREAYGENVFSKYGFVDAFNPTLTIDVPVHHGRVVPGVGWFDTDYLGIDQGPILAMTENYRSEFVWRVMKKNAHIVRGLRAAGFAGGWLDSAAVK